MTRRGRAALVAAALACTTAADAGAAEKLRVVVPDAHNLQYMAFWVADAGGHFAREGIEIELSVPPGPQQTAALFAKHEADAAVLPPPVYLSLVADKEPLVLVANLLHNDPIDLVVRRDVAAARHITPDMPLRERLVALRGIRLGVAPHPPTRLRALYASQGLDADAEITMVILHGREQNRAFAERRVDALYAHTPYLERAIVHDDAVVVVEQTRGEPPALANRQIHALAFLRSVVERRPELVTRAVRAIARAEADIHAGGPPTVSVLARAFPDRDRAELETIVRLYEPAIPQQPTVGVEGTRAAVEFFPAGMKKPDLAGVDLAPYVDPSFAKAATSTPPTPRGWFVVAAVAIVALLASALAIVRARRAA